MNRRSQSPTSVRMLAAAMLRADLAEHVSEHGTLADFARDRGMTERGVQKAWRIIREEMGAQAV